MHTRIVIYNNYYYHEVGLLVRIQWHTQQDLGISCH